MHGTLGCLTNGVMRQPCSLIASLLQKKPKVSRFLAIAPSAFVLVKDNPFCELRVGANKISFLRFLHSISLFTI